MLLMQRDWRAIPRSQSDWRVVLGDLWLFCTARSGKAAGKQRQKADTRDQFNRSRRRTDPHVRYTERLAERIPLKRNLIAFKNPMRNSIQGSITNAVCIARCDEILQALPVYGASTVKVRKSPSVAAIFLR
jgi:hypothetical protein